MCIRIAYNRCQVLLVINVNYVGQSVMTSRLISYSNVVVKVRSLAKVQFEWVESLVSAMNSNEK